MKNAEICSIIYNGESWDLIGVAKDNNTTYSNASTSAAGLMPASDKILLNNLDDLREFNIESNGFQKLQHVHEKWTKYFTNDKENKLVKEIKEDGRFQKLSDIALINVGITTGNNKYFSVNQVF